MNTPEPSPPDLDVLLRAPLDVPDAGFSLSVVQQIRALEHPPRDVFWPAWLFAAAGGALMVPRDAAMAMLGRLGQHAQELLASVQTLPAPAWDAQAPALWIPVALVLVLLVAFLQTVEE
jgi:hypothetical protein